MACAGWQLIQNNPFMYSANMPASLTSEFPMLTKVMEGERPSAPPWYHITSITSQGGKIFTSFAKYKKYNQGMLQDQWRGAASMVVLR